MPRALWQRRRAADQPRPRGRRWTGGLRRGGVLARRVLVRRRAARGLVTEPRHAGPLAQVAPADTLLVPAPRPSPVDGAGAVVSGESPGGPLRVGVVSGGGVVSGDGAGAVAGGGVGPTHTFGADPSADAEGLLPGERTLARRVRFLLVNLATLSSLSLGMLAILLAMRGDVRLAALCLIACVVADGLDGALARRLGVASSFGAQMDSLVDMCAFGVAAPVVLYASLAGAVPGAVAALACALVAGCAAIRLARFNVTPRDDRFFTGVPTTAAAAVLACAVLLDLPLAPVAHLVGLSVLAFAMVSSFPYATLARLARLPRWLWLAPLAGALVNLQLTFVVLVSLYLLSGPVLWLHRRRTA